MWVKIGDEFIDDGADLSDAASRLFVEGLSWSNRRGLDLHIPKRDLPRFSFASDPLKAADELVAAGFWVDEEATWFSAYRPEWQPSKAQMEKRRHQNAQSQERGRRHRTGDHSICLAGKCSSASVITADIASDALDESDADPVRFGSVRYGKTQLEQEQISYVIGCKECQRKSGFGSGPCPEHADVQRSAA